MAAQMVLACFEALMNADVCGLNVAQHCEDLGAFDEAHHGCK